jgi:hypothetical protein
MLSSLDNNYLLTMFQCRKSMARIKAVINERRLAYEGAVKIAEQQREEHYDKELLQHQTAQLGVERKSLRRRRAHKARKEIEIPGRGMEEAREATTQGAPAQMGMVQEAMVQGAAQDAVPQLVATQLATPQSVSEPIADRRTEAQ